ncbi:endonuclease/exonuclease/phosphatase family protein [Streptosporangium fragile]
MVLKLATWNIGGGMLGRSHQRAGSPSLDYYASVLNTNLPDVVCLQEAHDYDGLREGQTERLAALASYPYFASFPVSESHLAADANLALGVLSRFPIRDFTYRQFPNPKLEGVGPNDESWQLHDKGYAVGFTEVGDRTLALVTGHCFPLHRFGASPVEPRFAPMWQMLAQDLLTVGGTGEAWAAMDLNHGRVADLLGEVLRSGSYFSAFDGTPTTPKGAQWDHILYGRALRLLSTMVAPTASDHSYCQISVLM